MSISLYGHSPPLTLEWTRVNEPEIIDLNQRPLTKTLLWTNKQRRGWTSPYFS